MPVLVQPSMLAELVNNLLDNAVRYSDPGSPVRVRLEQVEGTAELVVEDQGIGIGEDELPHVFEPFYRSPEARRRGAPGLGLGLSVATRLAAAFGGTINVFSRPGQGSRFTLRLPLVRHEEVHQDGGSPPIARTSISGDSPVLERFTIGLRTRAGVDDASRERRSPDRPLAPVTPIERSAFPGVQSDGEPL
jgi:hypothetical protein